MEANGARKDLRNGDEHLARAVGAGDDAAFEILFQRHQPAILAFCRHMLGRSHDAQDAAQHTFLTAYRVLRAGDAPLALRSWLFAVARNRCISMLRARREQAADGRLAEVTTDGLAGQVQDRADLRALLRDVADLPDDQRAALLLAEIGDVSHKEIAGVIGVRREKVKALLFQARRALMAARDARDTPCLAIQQELSTARGAALRRAHLRRHLHVCPSCREFREQLRLQRDALALVLPVAPALLRDSILSGSAAGGHAAAAGASGVTLGASTGGVVGGHAVAAGANTAAVGSSTAAAGLTAVLKATAVKVGVVAAGGIAAGGAVAELPRSGAADSAAARNASVTVAAAPPSASPRQWAPTSGGARPAAGDGAGENARSEVLVRPPKSGGAPARPGNGRRDRVERGVLEPPGQARADVDSRGPGQAATERGPEPKAAKSKRAGDGAKAKSTPRGPQPKAARDPASNAKSTPRGPKPKPAGDPAINPKSTPRGPKPKSEGGREAELTPPGPKPTPAARRPDDGPSGREPSRAAIENSRSNGSAEAQHAPQESAGSSGGTGRDAKSKQDRAATASATEQSSDARR
jgi:RNA polymerase sigma factor (sigma-70 family)